MTKQNLKDLVYRVNGAAIEVHKQLGPGLLESIYHKCMKYELSNVGIYSECEMAVPVIYKEIEMETGLRCDFFVEECLVVELKAVETIQPIHEAQVLTYMKLLEAPMGLIINFNCSNIFKEGQKTYVNELYRKLKDE
ncbi:MAG: hypothetical protein K0S33_3426 [Bacteroidetes bacterium]|jgi:GxxExxY protein|nr:hypothetical protein [Bacteroidota bacterium]